MATLSRNFQAAYAEEAAKATARYGGREGGREGGRRKCC